MTQGFIRSVDSEFGGPRSWLSELQHPRLHTFSRGPTMASAGETGALLPRGEEAGLRRATRTCGTDDTSSSSSSSSRRCRPRTGTSRRSCCRKWAPSFYVGCGAGMLNGAAFVFIYALATIPLARIADMCGRKNLLAGSLIVWSTLTSLSGLSRTPSSCASFAWASAWARRGAPPRRSLSSPSCTVLVSAPAPWPSSSSASPPACPPRTSSGACSSIASGGEGSLA